MELTMPEQVLSVFIELEAKDEGLTTEEIYNYLKGPEEDERLKKRIEKSCSNLSHKKVLINLNRSRKHGLKGLYKLSLESKRAQKILSKLQKKEQTTVSTESTTTIPDTEEYIFVPPLPLPDLDALEPQIEEKTGAGPEDEITFEEIGRCIVLRQKELERTIMHKDEEIAKLIREVEKAKKRIYELNKVIETLNNKIVNRKAPEGKFKLGEIAKVTGGKIYE